MSVELIIVAVLMLVLGGILGWLFSARSGATVREELAAAQSRLEQGEEVVGRLRDAASAMEAEREILRNSEKAAQTELAAAIARADEQSRAHGQLVTELKDMRESLQLRFGEVAKIALEDAQGAFLKRADERFKQSEETTGQGLKTLLQPFETTLKRYEEGLGRIEKEREGSYRELTQAVGQLVQGNVGVVRETQRLANVMRSSPKHRGRWGEEQTQTILESAGLRENIDFTKQTTVNDGERNLRPDFIVNLPGNRCMVIDVKCPLVAFEQAYDEEDEIKRNEFLKQHAQALDDYAQSLSKKSYWRQFEKSPEFVIMFVPGEHHLAAAAERAPDLIKSAFKNGVLISSTINMLALANMMAGLWKQEVIREQANEIADAARQLYARIMTMSGHVGVLGKNLKTAVGAYNSFLGSLDTNVLTSAERLGKLGVETEGKAVIRHENIDLAVHDSRKLPSPNVVEMDD